MKLFTSISGIVRIIACWAFVLGLLNLANILILTGAVELYTNEFGNQMQVWLILLLDIIFGLGFFISGYGLWTHKSWGRTLFLWFITAWAAFNIIGLVISIEQYDLGALVVNMLRFVITLLIPLWYLHRPQVKAFFAENNSLGE